MRTLGVILDAIKDGDKPSYDECYWAVLALSALQYFEHRELRSVLLGDSSMLRLLGPEKMATYSSDRFRKCLNTDPKTWVGVNNDPSNPEYKSFRVVGKKLIDKAIAATEDTK